MDTDQWELTDQTAEHSKASPPGALRWFIFAVIHLAATALLIVPTLFIWYGVLAIGARAGWWIGDPTANDGVEIFSVPVGLVGWAIVLAMTAGLTAWLFNPRKSMRIIVAGWLMLVLGQMVIWAL